MHQGSCLPDPYHRMPACPRLPITSSVKHPHNHARRLTPTARLNIPPIRVIRVIRGSKSLPSPLPVSVFSASFRGSKSLQPPPAFSRVLPRQKSPPKQHPMAHADGPPKPTWDHRAPARGRAEKSRCEASGRVPRLAVTQSFQGIRWALTRAEAHATFVSLEATL